MKRALFVGLLLAVLFVANSVTAPSAKAWGPCDGPYGGYAGCNYYGGNYGGYNGGFVYNRVCYWAGYGKYRYLWCTYVAVPAWTASGYNGYSLYHNPTPYGSYNPYNKPGYNGMYMGGYAGCSMSPYGCGPGY